MSHPSSLITLLLVVIAFLLSVICGIVAGFLRHVDGATMPASLTRAGAAFGACLTVTGAAIELVLGR